MYTISVVTVSLKHNMVLFVEEYKQSIIAGATVLLLANEYDMAIVLIGTVFVHGHGVLNEPTCKRWPTS